MPAQIAPLTHRWLLVGNVNHVIYEHDDGWSRTMCGQLVKGGSLRRCTLNQQTGRKCKACLYRITSTQPSVRHGE